MGRLSHKVVLITGSTGIGAAVARRADQEGATVFVAALNAGEWKGASHLGDLSEEDTASAAVRNCIDQFGRVDCVFNVAGISGRRFGDGPLHECSTQGWDTLMRVNLRSTFLVCREALRHMLERGAAGSIVNTSSVLAFSPEPDHFATHAYAASKGAILALTKSAAAYYAASNIRINAIAPGLAATPMSRRAQESFEITRFMQTKQPLARSFLSPEDVASAVIYLLSDEARYVTGEVITIDGGWRFGH